MSTKLTSVIAVIALVQAGTAVPAPAGTWTVGPGAGYDYSTIQAALDAGTTVNGDTIYIAPGVYSETLEFNRSWTNLTVRGNADAFGLPSTDPTITRVTGGVKLGSLIAPIDGLTLENLYLQGNQPQNRVIGNVYNHKAVRDFTFRNSVVDGENFSGRDGIMVDSGGSTEGFGGDLTVDRVEFKDILSYGVMELHDGAQPTPFDTITFTNNHIHQCNGVVALRGNDPTHTGSVIVHGNTWEDIGGNQGEVGWAWAALEINRAANVDIQGNTIRNVNEVEWGGEGQAIQIWDIGPLNIADNTIEDNFQGIALLNHPPGTDYDVSAVTIHNNNLCDNQEYALRVGDGLTNGPVDAENNWWGNAGGPGVGGANDILGNADYDPWLTEPVTKPVIPEPATMVAVGLAVVGLGGYVRKRRKHN